MLLILLASIVAGIGWMLKSIDPVVAEWFGIASLVLFLLGALQRLTAMPLLLLACVLGAAGALVGQWNPAIAWWVNVAGITLFLMGVLDWISDGRRVRRHGKGDGDPASSFSACADSGQDNGACGGATDGCDGGGGSD